MNPEPTLEAVLHGLKVLYHSPDTTEKEQASAWLEGFQKSVHAWTISDQLLSHKHDLESCYFAAQTMRTKIQLHFYELPQNTHEALRDSLLNHLSSCDTNTSPVVVTQLCLALADLALLMAKWTTAINDLLYKFAPSPQSYPVLLEVLTVIPEETSSRHLRLGKNRRNELSRLMSSSFDGVHQFLVACLNNYHTDSRLSCKILRCLSSWFSVGAVPEKTISGSQLLQAVFHYLSDTQGQSMLHEAAADCLCAALYRCDDLTAYGELAHLLFHHVLTLHQPYTVCAASSDTDRCLNFARVFADMSESLTEQLVNTPDTDLGSFAQLDLLCATLDNDEYEVAEISFNFWYRLSELLYRQDDQQLNQAFSPYIQRVILSLCKHVQLDSDLDGILERTDDFYDFRLRASDLIKDIVFIIGSPCVFTEMSKSLDQQGQWNVLEALLFVMAAVGNNLMPDDETVVPHVMELILTHYCNPPTKLHPALAHTCIVLMGELREWIEMHTECLDSVLLFLLSCLRDSRLANTAAASLDHICVQCAREQQMLDNFPTLLQVVQEIDSFSITADATVKIIKSAAVIISKFPHSQVAGAVHQLCSYQLLPLQQLVANSDSSSKIKRQTPGDPGFWLDRLTSVVRYGVPVINNNGAHPCYQVVAELWTTLSSICDKYQADVKVIEKCCRCIRFAIRNLGSSFTPLLGSLVNLIVQLYSAQPHSCYLYLGAILVDEFGSSPGCTQGLLGMTEALAQPTFHLLSKPNGLIEHPDTVDDFFRLCLRFLQKDRVLLLDTDIASPLLRCAIAAMTLLHRDANTSVMRFLVELLTVSDNETDQSRKTREQVHRLLSDDGQALCNTLVQCCTSALPTDMMEDVGDVFLALVEFDRSSVQLWLHNSLNKLPRESSGGVVSATEQQLKQFHHDICKATDARDIVPVLRDFLMLYR